MASRPKLLRILLPIVVLALGIGGMRLLLHARKPPAPAPHITAGPVVEVVTVHVGDHQAVVTATGTIQPRRAVAITPEVGGRIVEVAPNLVAGGLFAGGDLLFAIEATDYRLAVEQARAVAAQARVELATTAGRAEVAQGEWQRLHPAGEAPPPLVVYEPQLASARAAVAAAEAAVAQAELNLARTRVTAPFNCRVRSESVEVGQVVRPGTVVAQVAGTDRAEVVVPLPPAALAALTIPRADGGDPTGGSAATVVVERDGRHDRWKGRVVRSLGEVDAAGRMSRVVVAVDDPYQLRHRQAGRADLEVGLFAAVELAGRPLSQVVAVERRAVHPGDQVWVATPEDTLQTRTISVVWREGETLFVDRGLADGERVVLTQLAGAADGLRLRPVEREATPRIGHPGKAER